MNPTGPQTPWHGLSTLASNMLGMQNAQMSQQSMQNILQAQQASNHTHNLMGTAQVNQLAISVERYELLERICEEFHKLRKWQHKHETMREKYPQLQALWDSYEVLFKLLMEDE